MEIRWISILWMKMRVGISDSWLRTMPGRVKEVKIPQNSISSVPLERWLVHEKYCSRWNLSVYDSSPIDSISLHLSVLIDSLSSIPRLRPLRSYSVNSKCQDILPTSIPMMMIVSSDSDMIPKRISGEGHKTGNQRSISICLWCKKSTPRIFTHSRWCGFIFWCSLESTRICLVQRKETSSPATLMKSANDKNDHIVHRAPSKDSSESVSIQDLLSRNFA